jgi:hypothetical protein
MNAFIRVTRIKKIGEEVAGENLIPSMGSNQTREYPPETESLYSVHLMVVDV